MIYSFDIINAMPTENIREPIKKENRKHRKRGVEDRNNK
jgi:hypothetical protein